MASRRRWLRRSADDEGDKRKDENDDRGARAGEPLATRPPGPAAPAPAAWPPSAPASPAGPVGPGPAEPVGPPAPPAGPGPTVPGPAGPAPAPPPAPPPADDPARTPLVQARYDRLAAAAGIEPNRDLSYHARSVLDWLARQDDATCSGVVELLQATSLATIRRR
jgi:hypothetical protein